jgi:hypothetical protein
MRRKILGCSVLVFIACFMPLPEGYSQPTGGGPGPPPPVPLSGIELLLAAGAGLGIKRLYDKGRKLRQ